LIQDNPKLKKIKRLKLPVYSFILDENGTYKKVLNKEKLLKKIEQMWDEESLNKEKNNS
ncbi:unnamed protein product, partial [marine sediment metagenome]